MKNVASTATVLAGALALVGAPAPAAAKATLPPMTVVPGGVIDGAGRIAYLHAAHGGIDAVDVANGALLWSDPAPQKPLAVVDDRLLVEVAAPDGVRLAVRETGAKGLVTTTSAPLPLPDWLHQGPAWAVSYDSVAEPDGPGRIRYRWWAQRRGAQGAHPARPRGDGGVEAAPETLEAAGALRIELPSGRVTPEPATAAAAAAPARTARGVVQSAWTVDGVSCALAIDGRRLSLRRTRASGQALPALPLGPATGVVARLSTDARLLVLAPTGAASGRSLWLPSGKRGPTLPTALLANAFAVVGAQLLVASEPRDPAAGGGRELRATALDGGAVRWTHRLFTRPALPPPR